MLVGTAGPARAARASGSGPAWPVLLPSRTERACSPPKVLLDWASATRRACRFIHGNYTEGRNLLVVRIHIARADEVLLPKARRSLHPGSKTPARTSRRPSGSLCSTRSVNHVLAVVPCFQASCRERPIRGSRDAHPRRSAEAAGSSAPRRTRHADVPRVGRRSGGPLRERTLGATRSPSS